MTNVDPQPCLRRESGLRALQRLAFGVDLITAEEWCADHREFLALRTARELGRHPYIGTADRLRQPSQAISETSKTTPEPDASVRQQPRTPLHRRAPSASGSAGVRLCGPGFQAAVACRSSCTKLPDLAGGRRRARGSSGQWPPPIQNRHLRLLDRVGTIVTGSIVTYRPCLLTGSPVHSSAIASRPSSSRAASSLGPADWLQPRPASRSRCSRDTPTALRAGHSGGFA
jgi:hypothetical protein